MGLQGSQISLPDWIEIDRWAAADGWPLRRFRVDPAPGAGLRGSILFQAGRADFIEKYLEAYAHFRQRGWAIEGFDWRGQAGSGRLLRDGRIGHCPPYPRLARDLAEYVADWKQRTPAPHILIGHSMGGHLIMRHLAEHPDAVDGAILLSPMLGIRSPLISERLGWLVARLACRLGLGERAVWQEDAAKSGHRQRNLTHSAARYAEEGQWRVQDPMLDVGPPSWGWMMESWDSIAWLRRPGNIERIKTPMLILYAKSDRLVRAAAVRAAARRLPHARILGHETAAHELLREIDPIRDWALGEIDAFLDQVDPQS